MTQASPETDTQYSVILTTTSSLSEGETIANALLKARLAACVNLYPITSVYQWQGEINRDQEYQLMIKTEFENFAAVANKIQALHSYEVPEIIALPIVTGTPSYLDWISASIKKPGD